MRWWHVTTLIENTALFEIPRYARNDRGRTVRIEIPHYARNDGLARDKGGGGRRGGRKHYHFVRYLPPPRLPPLF